VPSWCGLQPKTQWGVCAVSLSASTGVVLVAAAGRKELVLAEPEFQLLVGIDWATELHQACVLNPQGEVIAERAITHSGQAVGEFVEWLLGLASCSPAAIAVAIEVPHGALVETLVERGLSVFSVNPKQLDRFRDRYFPAGAKDDRRDAFVLASSLRTDLHCFRPVQLDDPLVLRLRDLSRLDDELRTSFNRHSCQLREQLYRYYPQLLRLSPSANEPWLWALLELAPTPQKACRLQPARIEKLLRAHRIRRYKANTVVEELRAPGFQLAAGTVDAASEHALLLVPHLRLINQQRAELARRMKSVLDQLGSAPVDDSNQNQHRDVEIILSLPGVGRVVAATMLAEASQALAHRDYHALRTYGGSAPITRRSGKKTIVLMRRACSERLRGAFYHWARVGIQHDPVSRWQYSQLRSAGHSHGRSLRGVSDRLLSVLCAMLRHGTLYDAERRQVPIDGAA
jgi:transposase